jgi:nucleotide sugar dehydrogenase
MIVTVVGMGKIGLPLATQFASKGYRVIGVDVNPTTVEKINSGEVPFPGEPELVGRLKEVLSKEKLSATLDTVGAVSQSDVVVVVVPLFVEGDGEPNFSSMDSATDLIGIGLKPGTLVSYETTLPVGTTRNRFAKALEEKSQLRAGIDFYVSFSPERVFTGRIYEDLRKYPKLIGGINNESADKARVFYESVLDFDLREDLSKPNGVWDLGSSEASELAKLAETTYRDVNIALANQFAKFADRSGIDVFQVIEACNSQPFSHIHKPGIAVGGHCIPIYPQMYLWNDPDATVVRASRDANKSMPEYSVSLLENKIGSLHGRRVAVLGAAYRGGVKETAFSGVFDVVSSLVTRGALALVHDPMYSDEELGALGFESYKLGQPIDAVIVQTDHVEYRALTEEDFPGAELIIDGRRIIGDSLKNNIETVVLGAASSEQ